MGMSILLLFYNEMVIFVMNLEYMFKHHFFNKRDDCNAIWSNYKA